MRQSRLFIIVSLVAILTVACNSGGNKYNKEADQLIENARRAKDFKHLATLADSLQKAGLVTDAKAYYWQGYASDRQMRYRTADFYWKRAIEAAAKSEKPEEMDFYAKSASRLANMLMTRGDYEGTVKMAVPVAKRLEALSCDTTSDYVNMLIYIGCCQLGLGMSGDTINDNFLRAYKKHASDIEIKHSDAAYKDAFAGIINIVFAFNTTGHYEDALKWNERYGKFITEYEQRQDASADYIDKQWARYDIFQAIALAGLGRTDEAEAAYNDYLKTSYSKTPDGRLVSNDYLEPQGRWKEVAANYESLDKIVDEYNAKHSLENMQKAALKKYRANLLAGRRDTAMAVSMQISEMLDSAIARSRRTDAEEQKIIRDKEDEMAIQREELAHKRAFGVYGIFGTIIALLLIYVLYHLVSKRRMKEAHNQLQADYAEAETQISERARQDSELSIARDILLSDEPESFPANAHLAFCAPEQTEKSDACEFIDYRIVNDNLYLCVAAAHGDKVKASLATSLVRSQFRSMAALEISPERIATAVNDTMAIGEHAPVKLFLGQLNLATGRLGYCNAGHPSPVVADDDIHKLSGEGNNPVGVEPGKAYELQQMEVAPESVIFLYSDALTGLRNAEQKMLGEKRAIGDVLQAKKTCTSLDDFVRRITEGIRRFSATDALPNMLAIQYK